MRDGVSPLASIEEVPGVGRRIIRPGEDTLIHQGQADLCLAGLAILPGNAHQGRPGSSGPKILGRLQADQQLPLTVINPQRSDSIGPMRTPLLAGIDTPDHRGRHVRIAEWNIGNGYRDFHMVGLHLNHPVAENPVGLGRQQQGSGKRRTDHHPGLVSRVEQPGEHLDLQRLRLVHIPAAIPIVARGPDPELNRRGPIARLIGENHPVVPGLAELQRKLAPAIGQGHLVALNLEDLFIRAITVMAR